MVFMSLLSNAHTHMYTFSLDRQLLLLCFRRHTYEFLTNEQTHNAHRHRKKNALLGQDGFADWTWCSRIEYIRGMVLACTTTTHRVARMGRSVLTYQFDDGGHDRAGYCCRRATTDRPAAVGCLPAARPRS